MMAILQGRARISVPSSEGREAVFKIMGEGEIFGEIALLDGKERTADAVAITACELLVVERRAFLPILRRRPHPVFGGITPASRTPLVTCVEDQIWEGFGQRTVGELRQARVQPLVDVHTPTCDCLDQHRITLRAHIAMRRHSRQDQFDCRAVFCSIPNRY
jgi:hypothetical protein